MLRWIQDQRGSSLLELVFAIAVVGIVLLPITGSFTTGIAANREARNNTIATNLASDKMESLRYSFRGSNIIPDATTTETIGIFTRKVNVKEIQRYTNPRGRVFQLVRVTVTVEWEGKSIKLVSCFCGDML